MSSPLFYLVILIMAVFSLIDAQEELRFTNEIVYLATVGRLDRSSSIGYLIPMLAGLPFADAYCTERKDGYHYSVMVRGSKLRYSVSKICAANLSAVLIIWAAEILYISGCILECHGNVILSGDVTTDFFTSYSISNTGTTMYWEHSLLNLGHPELIIVSWTMEYALAGSLFPGIALCASLVIRNRYVLMAVPFAFAELWATVAGAFKSKMEFHFLYPDYCSGTPYGNWHINLFVVSLIWIVQISIFTYGILKETR